MRTFEKTHPWITFAIDLSRAPARLWTLLGECQAHCEHISNAPISPEIQADLLQVFLAKGAQATTAIEGNTLSEEEVLRLIRKELRLPKSKQYLGQEIDNVLDACNIILHGIEVGVKPSVTPEFIAILNESVLEKLELEVEVVPGKVRTYSVGVPGYRGAPAEDCKYLVSKLCEWLNGPDFESPEDMPIVYAIVKAALAHLYLAWIHPFGDGNGRTARLVEFCILISSGVPHPAAHLLSNHYNQTRTEYYRQLMRASRSGGDVTPFLLYAVQGFLDGLRSQLEMIVNQQWEVVWRDLVWDKFRGRRSESQIRRRRLVFALTEHAEPVPLRHIPELTTKLAIAYANKTSKTVARDVNALVDMGLLVKEKQGVRARLEMLSGFAAVKAPGSD